MAHDWGTRDWPLDALIGCKCLREIAYRRGLAGAALRMPALAPLTTAYDKGRRARAFWAAPAAPQEKEETL